MAKVFDDNGQNTPEWSKFEDSYLNAAIKTIATDAIAWLQDMDATPLDYRMAELAMIEKMSLHMVQAWMDAASERIAED